MAGISQKDSGSCSNGGLCRVDSDLALGEGGPLTHAQYVCALKDLESLSVKELAQVKGRCSELIKDRKAALDLAGSFPAPSSTSASMKLLRS